MAIEILKKHFCLALVLFVIDGLCFAFTPEKIPNIKKLISKKHGTLAQPSYIFYNDTNTLGNIPNLQVLDERSNKRFSNAHGAFSRLRTFFRTTFLPSGYPLRTPPGYLSSSVWSWIQDLSTQLRSVVATQRVLEGIGVGREGATALSASLNFIVRDGFGMASTLLFTAMASSRFRSDVKRWRIFADVINDVGITLEVSATLVSQKYFLFMICLGNMCKAMCGVAAGACGGAINLHWAKGSDISDINAKFGAQHTVTGALGLFFAAVFAKTVSHFSQKVLMILFGLLTALHILANMNCMKLLSFDYFNAPRMNLVVQKMLSTITDDDDDPNKIVMIDPPNIICKEEPLLFPFFGNNHACPITIRFGVSFHTVYSSTNNNELMKMDQIVPSLEENGYCIVHDIRRHSKNHRINKRGSVVYVMLSEKASGLDKTKAYFHAILLGHEISSQNFKSLDLDQRMEDTLTRLWPIFAQMSKDAGWDLDRSDFQTEGFEIEISE